MTKLTDEEIAEIEKNVRNAQYSRYEREVIQKLLDHINDRDYDIDTSGIMNAK